MVMSLFECQTVVYSVPYHFHYTENGCQGKGHKFLFNAQNFAEVDVI